MGITHLKKAFELRGVRTILFASFLHNFAWSYFFEFYPVYLISRFHFSSWELGLFYGLAGAIYALSTGLLIRPFIKRFTPETLFFAGNFLSALVIASLLFIQSFAALWVLVIIIIFFVAFVTPSSTTAVSDSATSSVQGEALGVLSSVNAAALVISPLFSGSLVGKYNTLPMWIGSTVTMIAAISVLLAFGGKLLNKRRIL